MDINIIVNENNYDAILHSSVDLYDIIYDCAEIQLEDVLEESVCREVVEAIEVVRSTMDRHRLSLEDVEDNNLSEEIKELFMCDSSWENYQKSRNIVINYCEILGIESEELREVRNYLREPDRGIIL